MNDDLFILPESYLKEGLHRLDQELTGDRYLDLTSQQAFSEGLRISNFIQKFRLLMIK